MYSIEYHTFLFNNGITRVNDFNIFQLKRAMILMSETKGLNSLINPWINQYLDCAD